MRIQLKPQIELTSLLLAQKPPRATSRSQIMAKRTVKQLVFALVAVAFAFTPLFASYGMTFYESGGNIVCHGGVEKDGSNPDYIAVDLRIFAPSGQLLAHDAVATGYKPYLHTTIMGPANESGTYSCVGELDDGQSRVIETYYVDID